MNDKRIFIVEDEGIVAADLADRLNHLGYTVVGQAASGELAIKKISAMPPDLVLMDIILQGDMDGVETAEMVSKLYKIPVIFLTAHADDATIKRAQITGPFGYILKPFEERELQIAIEIALYRKEAEELLRRRNRALRMLSECNQELLRATDESSLLQNVCRIAVEAGGYRLAWVGFREENAAKAIRPVGRFGYDEGYVDSLNMTWADTERGRGPVGTAVRTGQRIVSRQLATLPDFDPWREQSLKNGYASFITMPLLSYGHTFGILAIYSANPDDFAAEEAELLNKLADNLAYGLTVLRLRADRQKAQAEVHRLNAELEQRVLDRTAELMVVNQELEAFSYSISHDLRTPLRTIDGFSKILLEDCGDRLDAASRGNFERIRAASQLMGHLIDALQQLSQYTRKKMHRTPVDLSALTRSVVQSLQAAEPNRRVEVVIEPNLIAQADASLMLSALTNLLGNAWKFTGKKTDAKIEFGRTVGAGGPAYFVRDNGAGFDPRYADKLFGAFQRLHSRNEFPGTGIGLATVKRIIRRHHGQVWAEGEPGHGATFYFTLTNGLNHPHEQGNPIAGGG